MEATCQRWLLLVGEAAADLLRNATRFGLASSALEAQVAARRAALEALFRSEQWVDLQKDAAQAIEHFRFEGERLRSEAVAAEAAQRSRQRRTLDAARSIAASLAKAGQPVPVALTAAIEGAMTATGPDLDAMQRTVEASIATLVQGQPKTQSSGRVTSQPGSMPAVLSRLSLNGSRRMRDLTLRRNGSTGCSRS